MALVVAPEEGVLHSLFNVPGFSELRVIELRSGFLRRPVTTIYVG